MPFANWEELIFPAVATVWHGFRWLGHRSGTDWAFQALCPLFAHAAKNTWWRKWLNSPELSPLPAWTLSQARRKARALDLRLSSGRWAGGKTAGNENRVEVILGGTQQVAEKVGFGIRRQRVWEGDASQVAGQRACRGAIWTWQDGQ